jgi:ABC-2 type transport system ATP-binding protein
MSANTAAAPAPAPGAPVATATADVPVVEVRGLVKRFGSFSALSGLSLTIPGGAFYAFLGPNGAGKSTTIALLTGIYGPDEGELRLLGMDARRAPLEIKRHIGVVPEELALFERLTGRQYLTFCGRMYGLSGPESAARAEELLALTELTAKAGALVADYSKGMRRRLAIAAALIHAPRLLFLDEPFEGIDVLAAGVIRELLRELSARGVTILLTTHVLEIAERLATHAGFIHQGKMVDEGSVAELKHRHGVGSVEAIFERLIHVPVARRAQLSFYGGSGSGSESGSGERA